MLNARREVKGSDGDSVVHRCARARRVLGRDAHRDTAARIRRAGDAVGQGIVGQAWWQLAHDEDGRGLAGRELPVEAAADDCIGWRRGVRVRWRQKMMQVIRT